MEAENEQKAASDQSVIAEGVRCDSCHHFDEYETGAGRNEDNCVTWLCNCGKCPNDAAPNARLEPPANTKRTEGNER